MWQKTAKCDLIQVAHLLSSMNFCVGLVVSQLPAREAQPDERAPANAARWFAIKSLRSSACIQYALNRAPSAIDVTRTSLIRRPSPGKSNGQKSRKKRDAVLLARVTKRRSIDGETKC